MATAARHKSQQNQNPPANPVTQLELIELLHKVACSRPAKPAAGVERKD